MDVDGKIVDIIPRERNVFLDGQAIIVWNIFGEREINLLCDDLGKRERN